MPKKLTNQDYQQKLDTFSNGNYLLVSNYNGKTKPVDIKCQKHNVIFTVTAECFMRPTSRGKCPKCLEEERKQRYLVNRTLVKCSYCGKEFYEQYIEYLKLKTELVEKQEQVWLQASEDGNDYKLEDFTKQLQYNHNIEEQILRIGAEINDVEY